MLQKDYRGVVWTNHALQRLSDRGLKQGDVWAAFNRPDNSKYSKGKGAWVYQRVVEGQEISVVAKKDNKGKWVIISVWSKDVAHKQGSTLDFLKKRFCKLFGL